MKIEDDKLWRLGPPPDPFAPRRSALGQHLLETHDPALSRVQRHLLVLLDGRRDPHVLGLILDDVAVCEELDQMQERGWIEWENTPGRLRRAA